MTVDPPFRTVHVTPGVREHVQRACLNHPGIGWRLVVRLVRAQIPDVTVDEVRSAIAETRDEES